MPAAAHGSIDRPDHADHPVHPVTPKNESSGDAIVVATTNGKPKLPTYYASEAGTTMANGEVAPARRVAAFTTYQSLQDPGRPAGFILFATGMAWLTGQI